MKHFNILIELINVFNEFQISALFSTGPLRNFSLQLNLGGTRE